MDSKSAYKIILSMLLVAFVFTNCDVQDSNVGTFEDAADKIPNFTVIPGAENVSVKVERNNNDAYFNVNLGNIGDDAMILDGDYLGWCAHWSAPIGTGGEVYEDVSLYSTMDDENWNELNYLLNMRRHFMDTVEGASYKEVQAVIWTIIDYKEFDVESNRIFSDLNLQAFNKILEKVRLFGSNFRLRPGMIQAIFVDMSVNETDGESTQTVIVERGETAYGGDSEGGGSAWWWYFDSSGPETQKVRVGSKGEDIGDVTVSAGDDDVIITASVTECTVNFDLDEFWGAQDVDEPLKIQGYAEGELPASRPASGPFTTYKGDLVDDIVIPCYPYYVIHLDAYYYEETTP